MKNKEIQNQDFRTWVEINQQALKNNYNTFRRLINSKCLLMAVVKSNAYGHDLIDFSRMVENFGVDWLGVDSIIEAKTLREAGLKKPILVLGYTLQNKIDMAIKNNISLTIADFQSLKNLKSINKNDKKLKIHLKIDTGMHRQGFFVSEIPAIIKILKSKNFTITLEGIYTHFSSAKNPAFPFTTLCQIKEFKKTIKLFESAGFNTLIKHAAATSGTILFPQSHFDMVRIGIGFYGLWPSKETKEAFKRKNKLQPVLSWKTIISQIKKLPKGSSVGYDLTETLHRPSKIAILPIGYWHGFSRSFSSIGKVLINGNEAKIIGRVSMNMISIDVTNIKNVKIGDKVIIIGNSGKLEISADEMAHLSDTSNYEIVTRINPLIKRIIV
ncbi:alanine racemase [Candidatus Kuenenbacteria bacterium HGW-Kuenenbacteria-1]|uniref:Alanine racemase n=1 Tax=Candidatus Kuenenbacteria bacterium HGW-Kuenenbacteria-1 TaxID=2013812 RepID=A0A2N1UMX3_9BACT|nr:MAG: alanine racemase [Candidatus Kuenenbacteria bacterium HGW-Kuenenbacteria-1]